MKKVLSLTLAVCMLFTLTSCGNNPGGRKSEPGKSKSAVRQNDSGGKSKVSEETGAATVREIDVDLTSLSSTMVYSEVYNMIYAPEDYIGKTVKMNGAFSLYCQKEDGNGQPDFNYPVYYSCVIADATACCSQGMEFVPDEKFTYPDDYPEPGEDITVTGTFETYEEEGNIYCHIVDAEISA